jgi:Na+/melibiose symporter-like transporter
MIADCVDYEEYTNGIRPDGVFFSGQSFITKLSAGIASLISGAVYAIVGFSDKNVALLNNALVNGADFKAYNGGKYAAAMFFLISIPPAVGMVLAARLNMLFPTKSIRRFLQNLSASAMLRKVRRKLLKKQLPLKIDIRLFMCPALRSRAHIVNYYL